MTRLAVALILAVCASACAPESNDSEPAGEDGPLVDALESLGETRPSADSPGREDGILPPGWTFRPDQLDHPHELGTDSTADVFFATMTPGWHVTTGPAGIFVHPASTADGAYSVSSDMHLFDPGDRREAFGLYFGGADLDSDAQAYTYFLIRQGGQFLVKERAGAETKTLVDWTSNDAILSFDESSGSSVMNSLMVEVGADTVAFSVNGVQVGWLPADSIRTDGQLGFRVNHGLNLHISSLNVEEQP